jgi:hypothetical protein
MSLNVPYVPDPALAADVVFGGMVVLALLLSKSPFGWPLKWAETFYHELSHGIVCLLTWGRVKKIELEFNGAGCCTTSGGWRVPTLLAGYTGAALWGGMLYMGGWLLGAHGATLWLKIELAVIAFVFVVWARDWRTWLILMAIGGTYAWAIWGPESRWLPYFLQFVGVYVMLNAIRAPLFLIDGQHVGDGAALADIFRILPEGVWIALWWAFALAVMLACMVMTLPHFATLAAMVEAGLRGLSH